MIKHTLRMATLLLCATLTLTSTAGVRKAQQNNSLRPDINCPSVEQTVFTGVIMDSIDYQNYFFRSIEGGLILVQFSVPVELDFGAELQVICGRHETVKFADENYQSYEVLEYK